MTQLARPNRRTFIAGLSALAVAPLLAACGDDGEPTSGTDTGSAAGGETGARRGGAPSRRRSRTSTARPWSRRRRRASSVSASPTRTP